MSDHRSSCDKQSPAPRQSPPSKTNSTAAASYTVRVAAETWLRSFGRRCNYIRNSEYRKMKNSEVQWILNIEA